MTGEQRQPVEDRWPRIDNYPLNPDAAGRERDTWRARHNPDDEPDREPRLCPIDGGVLVEEERTLGEPTRFVHYFGREHSDQLAFIQYRVTDRAVDGADTEETM